MHGEKALKTYKASVKGNQVRVGISAPKDVSEAAGGKVSFTNPAIVQGFSKAVLQLAEHGKAR